jgi:hypothetical protein
MEQVFATAVDAEDAHVEGEQRLDRLEAQVLALRMVRAQQELVAEVRALVIDAHARGRQAAPHGHGEPERVIGIDEVEGGTVEVELRVDAGFDADLQTLARRWTAPARQTEMIRDAHGSDVGAERHVGRDALPARERPGALRIGEQRAEHVAVRQLHESERFVVGNVDAAVVGTGVRRE